MSTASLALLLVASAVPQEASPVGLAAPFRLHTTEGPMGKGRLYPSPTLYDLDGDGIAELILGDLLGNLTYSVRSEGQAPGQWGKPRPLIGADGTRLKFNNW